MNCIPPGQPQIPPPDPWDGKSSYDPATGTILLGRFADGAPARYLLHQPGPAPDAAEPGPRSGLVTGDLGTGKTSTLNIVALETGFATECSRCKARGDCGSCDPQRIGAVWLADPQRQGLAAWRGSADLLGWGPEGCAELIDLTSAAACARAARFTGTRAGWPGPAAGMPIILLGIDELLAIVLHSDQDLAACATTALADGVLTWRKAGIHLLLSTPLFPGRALPAGLSREIREAARYLNAVVYRASAFTSLRNPVPGANPQDLPQEELGAGYIAGADSRPGHIFRAKYLPRAPRLQALTDLVRDMPVTYDADVQEILDARGIKPGQILAGPGAE